MKGKVNNSNKSSESQVDKKHNPKQSTPNPKPGDSSKEDVAAKMKEIPMVIHEKSAAPGINEEEKRLDVSAFIPKENIANLLQDRSIQRYSKAYFVSLFSNTSFRTYADGKHVPLASTKLLAAHYCKQKSGGATDQPRRPDLANIEELKYKEPHNWQDCVKFVAEYGPFGRAKSQSSVDGKSSEDASSGNGKSYKPRLESVKVTTIEMFKGLLNQISFQNKEVILNKALTLDFSNDGVISQVVTAIMQKAMSEQNYVLIYSELTSRLCRELELKFPGSTEKIGKTNTKLPLEDKRRIGLGFRHILDMECQQEFHTRISGEISVIMDKGDRSDMDQWNSNLSLWVQKYEGLMFFIADLCKSQVLVVSKEKGPENPIGSILHKMMTEKPLCEYKLATAKKVIERTFDASLVASFPEIRRVAEDLSKNCGITRIRLLYTDLVSSSCFKSGALVAADSNLKVLKTASSANPVSKVANLDIRAPVSATPTKATVSSSNCGVKEEEKASNAEDDWISVGSQKKKQDKPVAVPIAMKSGGKGGKNSAYGNSYGSGGGGSNTGSRYVLPTGRDKKDIASPPTPPPLPLSLANKGEKALESKNNSSFQPSASPEVEVGQESFTKFSVVLDEFSRGNKTLSEVEAELKLLPVHRMAKVLFGKLVREVDVSWLFEVVGMCFNKSILSEDAFFDGMKEFVKPTRVEVEDDDDEGMVFYDVPYSIIEEEAVKMPQWLGMFIGKLYKGGHVNASCVDKLAEYVKAVEESTRGECRLKSFPVVVQSFNREKG